MCRPSISLKLSSLLLFSQLINISYQFEQCLVTLKNVRVERDYSFSLAQVQDLDDPMGPQEACYYSCGGQILTQSPDIGDMTQLTLLDKSFNFLTTTGFLRIGHAYFINHLGFTDEQGGNGIGCVEIESTKKFKHYPLSHSTCKKARNAICGFWGKQTIPLGPMNRNGTEIEHPNASEIEIKTTELPEPTPEPTPEPKREPEEHGNWENHRGGDEGWGWRGRWNGQHHWDEAEDPYAQLNLAATMEGIDQSFVGPPPVLADSIVTLPVVKYERDPQSGQLVEVTRYASFVQLDDYRLAQHLNGEYKTEHTNDFPFATPPASLGHPENIIDNLDVADEDYEFRAPVDKVPEINNVRPVDAVDHIKEIEEIPVIDTYLPSELIPNNEAITTATDLVPLVQATDEVTMDSERINFEDLDDLGDIIGNNPITNILNGNIASILPEEMSNIEIASVANNIVEIEQEEMPIPFMDSNSTENENVDINVMGKLYKVIPHFNSVEKTMEQARALCLENDYSMSSIESTDYSELTTKLKEAGLDNIAIGSWNGNNYLLSGPNCLVVQVGLGVFPTECASAAAVMCQI